LEDHKTFFQLGIVSGNTWPVLVSYSTLDVALIYYVLGNLFVYSNTPSAQFRQDPNVPLAGKLDRIGFNLLK